MKWIDYAFYTENGGALDEETRTKRVDWDI
jgi:hypothetical protein